MKQSGLFSTIFSLVSGVITKLKNVYQNVLQNIVSLLFHFYCMYRRSVYSRLWTNLLIELKSKFRETRTFFNMNECQSASTGDNKFVWRYFHHFVVYYYIVLSVNLQETIVFALMIILILFWDGISEPLCEWDLSLIFKKI